ncbi:hypothetical protein NQZ79_g4499 [Umbelopsis isabellina]|nr:hypothetical protein NQZ79_g4499 [Umbelopsis isabellina]
MDPTQIQDIPPPVNKKNKKKKKAGPPVEIDAEAEALVSTFPVELQFTRAKGRHAVAQQSLEAGTTVCREKATFFIVRSPFIDKQCHVCLNSLEDDKGDELAHVFTCDSCNKVYYCSKNCMEQDKVMHNTMCSTISRLDDIANDCSVDTDLLRILLGLMAQRAEVDNNSESVKPTPYKFVEDLVHNREKISKDFVDVITKASERLNDLVPEKLKMEVNEMVLLACRINCNAHGLGDVQSRNTDSALGLFPLGAMFFNHSCEPNCNFVGLRDGQLEFRTLKQVAKGEELCVSYIDLFAPRNERRGNLLYTKQFWCKCKRCTTPMEKSIDRFLNGVVCRQCQKGVYVIPPAQINGVVPGQDSEKSNYLCSQCDHTASHSNVAGAIERADKQYAQAITMIRQRKYGRAKEMLNGLIKGQEYAKTNYVLHEYNAILMNALVPLMNCLMFENNYLGAIGVNRQILHKLKDSGAVAENSPEIGDFLFNLGEVCQTLAKENSGKTVVEQRWQQEAEKAFKECVALRKIAFGEDHPKTQAAQNMIDTSKC